METNAITAGPNQLKCRDGKFSARHFVDSKPVIPIYQAV
jgi:hypothetical protein